jgi:hypothetical protein
MKIRSCSRGPIGGGLIGDDVGRLGQGVVQFVDGALEQVRLFDPSLRFGPALLFDRLDEFYFHRWRPL